MIADNKITVNYCGKDTFNEIMVKTNINDLKVKTPVNDITMI